MRRANVVLLLVLSLGSASCMGGGSDCLDEPLVTESGLRIEDVTCGQGDEAGRSSRVLLHYTARLEDGTVFDSTEGEPVRLVLGAGQLIHAWEEGIPGMEEGGHRRLVAPPELGYGRVGLRDRIPPDETLTFDLELVEVVDD